MPVPTSIAQLSQTEGSNSPAGSEAPSLLDNYDRAHASFIARLRDGQGFSTPLDVASAATTDIGNQPSFVLRVTGTTTITSFGANYNAPRFLVFGGALTLTHNATSLVLPTGANITTAAGDTAIAVPNLATPTGWRVLAYQKADGTALAGIQPGSITSSSLTMSTARLLGRTTAGSGAIQELTAGSRLVLSSGELNVQAASTTQEGAVELATGAEVQAGTDTTRAITPSTLRTGFGASGSAPVYACRAWVNFNGSGSLSVKGASNVSSVTDNGLGDYTVNFTTAMPTSGYAVVTSCETAATSGDVAALGPRATSPKTSSSVRLLASYVLSGTTLFDPTDASVAIFC